MKRVFAFSSVVGLLSFTVPSVGIAQPGVDGTVCNPHVEAVFSDGHGLVWGGLAPVAHAVQRELRRLGVEMTWAKKPELAAASSALRIVLLPHRANEWGRTQETLGAVHLDKASPSSVFVFYPAVLDVLGDPGDPSSILEGSSRPDWLRGLARIIVHEMIHFLIPGRPHDGSGLFAQSLKASNLLGPKLELEAETRSALVSRLCSAVPRGPGE